MAERTAVVVGGGIGGLAAAAALARTGRRVTVLERAPRFEAIGAGITIMTNALRALAALGLEDAVRAGSRPDRGGGLRTPSGRWLARSDTEKMRDQLGIEIVALHRAELHRILLDAVPKESLTAGATVTGVRSEPGSATVEYTVDGAEHTITADLVVAADGINSTIRSQLWPGQAEPTYSGVTAWRGVADLPSATELTQTWGAGVEFGVVPLTDGRVYWFVASGAPEGKTYPDDLAYLREHYGDWHQPIPDLMAATDPDAVMHHDIYHLDPPLKSYVDKRVVLLGDAAHAMTPNLGQGACQAIEDAVTLAALCRSEDLAAALAEYQRSRLPRTQRVAATALRLSRFSVRISNPVAVALRNLVLSVTPPSRAIKSMAWLGDWSPPVARL